MSHLSADVIWWHSVKCSPVIILLFRYTPMSKWATQKSKCHSVLFQCKIKTVFWWHVLLLELYFTQILTVCLPGVPNIWVLFFGVFFFFGVTNLIPVIQDKSFQCLKFATQDFMEIYVRQLCQGCDIQYITDFPSFFFWQLFCRCR